MVAKGMNLSVRYLHRINYRPQIWTLILLFIYFILLYSDFIRFLFYFITFSFFFFRILFYSFSFGKVGDAFPLSEF